MRLRTDLVRGCDLTDNCLLQLYETTLGPLVDTVGLLTTMFGVVSVMDWYIWRIFSAHATLRVGLADDFALFVSIFILSSHLCATYTFPYDPVPFLLLIPS